MEENYIWDGDTHFYINMEKRTYGCRKNKKDLSKAREIIEYFKTTKRNQIEAWKKIFKEEESSNGITSINNSEKVVVENQQA